MPSRPGEIAALMFAYLIAREDVTIVDEIGECHIVSDDWTLVLQGDPVGDVMIALDDESGDADALLRAAMSEGEFAALRNLDGELKGQLSSLLASSPDDLARTLATILQA